MERILAEGRAGREAISRRASVAPSEAYEVTLPSAPCACRANAATTAFGEIFADEIREVLDVEFGNQVTIDAALVAIAGMLLQPTRINPLNSSG
jgi:hypothetical protein